MIKLYTWPTPNGYKVQIMLEEVGVPYTVHPIDITRGAQFDSNYLALNPNNKVPTIVDDEGPDGAPITVFETGAILIYLAEKTGRFIPSDGRARCEVMQWLTWQMGGLGPMLGQAQHFHRYDREGALRDRTIHQGGSATAECDGAKARRPRLSGRRLFDRRHRLLHLDPHPQDGQPDPRRPAARLALVR